MNSNNSIALSYPAYHVIQTFRELLTGGYSFRGLNIERTIRELLKKLPDVSPFNIVDLVIKELQNNGLLFLSGNNTIVINRTKEIHPLVDHRKTPRSKRWHSKRKKTSNLCPSLNLTLVNDLIVKIQLDRLQIEDETFQIRLSSKPDQILLVSIKKNGIQIPLVVRPHPLALGKFQIVCGFRRIQAARSLKLKAVPAIIRILTTEEALIVAYTENQYRKTLGDLDRAHAIIKLRQAGQTNAEIARSFGLSRRQIQRIAKMIDFPDVLKTALADPESRIATTHALILWQAKRKYGESFDLQDWIVLAREIGSTNELKRVIDDNYLPEISRNPLVSRTNAGDIVTIVTDIKQWKLAPQELKSQGIKELTQIIAELHILDIQ